MTMASTLLAWLSRVSVELSARWVVVVGVEF